MRERLIKSCGRILFQKSTTSFNFDFSRDDGRRCESIRSSVWIFWRVAGVLIGLALAFGYERVGVDGWVLGIRDGAGHLQPAGGGEKRGGVFLP